jgi:hypothetical protein
MDISVGVHDRTLVSPLAGNAAGEGAGAASGAGES